jgi:hypothetical protein
MRQMDILFPISRAGVWPYTEHEMANKIFRWSIIGSHSKNSGNVAQLVRAQHS